MSSLSMKTWPNQTLSMGRGIRRRGKISKKRNKKREGSKRTVQLRKIQYRQNHVVMYFLISDFLIFAIFHST